MAYNIQPFNFKLTGKDYGAVDLADALEKGFKNYKGFHEAVNSPELIKAQISDLQGKAQKNAMLGKLFQSLMGAEGIGDDGGSQVDNGMGAGNSNDRRNAIIKATTGIDFNTRSPEALQALRTQGTTTSQANKANLTTGSNNVVREILQDKVSLPSQYLGPLGTYNMLKDRISAGQGDKAANERLIRAGVAYKLVPEYAGAQLGSQGQKSTVSSLAHQNSAIKQGWPNFGHFLSSNLSPQQQKETEKRHNEIVKNVNKQRESFLSSGGKERPFAEENGNNSPPKKFSWSDISHTAQQRGISENEVINKLAEKMGIPIEQFMTMILAEK
jgi:hypothetical protein